MPTTSFDLDSYLQQKSDAIDRALHLLLPKESESPEKLHEAMRYMVFSGGKRIRPVLTLSVAEMCGGPVEQAKIAASAIELIHTYSLIHDDLPSLDNDSLRRGRATCHVRYGEAMAILTGDALLTLAFEILGRLKNPKHFRLVADIAKAAGTIGMIGGQVLDIEAKNRKITLEQLNDINRKKTGALIQVSCLAGAVVSDVSHEEELRILRFGEYLGFAFQIVDDIMDADGYLHHMNERQARQKAQELIQQAKQELSGFSGPKAALESLADYVVERKK